METNILWRIFTRFLLLYVRGRRRRRRRSSRFIRRNPKRRIPALNIIEQDRHGNDDHG